MTIYDKPFKTYEQQIELLRTRNLNISNQEFAIHALDTISYYDLINRYQKHFIPDGEHFIEGTTIEQLYSLSMFDRSIQAFILKYSVDMSVYLAKSKYKESYQNPNNVLTFDAVQLECFKTRNNDKIANNPTLYYREHHNHIPPWILLKNLSFSNSINLFKLLKNAQRDDVVNELLPNEPDRIIPLNDKTNFIICALEAIRVFRNAAAHNLDFTALRTDETRKIPSSTLSKCLPGKILIKKEKKKIEKNEKVYLKGVYGVMLSMMVLLKTDYLKKQFIVDFLSVFNGIDDREIRPFLFQCYANIADMPADTQNRFLIYLGQT